MRFAVNLSLLFTELDLLERPRAAREAGFEAVEFWWPFDSPEPSEREVDRFIGALSDAGVALTGLNFDAGAMPQGERGLVSQPARADRFRANVPVAVAIAERTGCGVLNALYGNRDEDTSPWRQDECARENLVLAAEAAKGTATVVVEPLNSIESPRYPLVRTAHAVELIDRVYRDSGARLGLLYDVYHMQRMEGNLIDTIGRYASHLAHVQIADSPGRGAPGTGEIAYGRVLDALYGSGYRGDIGLEYKSPDSAHAFDWLLAEGRGELDGAAAEAPVSRFLAPGV